MRRGRAVKWVAGFLLSIVAGSAEPVPVRRAQGYLHGYVVLKDLDDKILASGDLIQTTAGGRVTAALTLHFKDGSLYQETSVFSQRRTYQLLTYKQVRKGPAFKTQETLTLDTSTGKVGIEHTDKDGKVKTIADKLTLPPDLANGIIPIVLTDVDPKVETTLVDAGFDAQSPPGQAEDFGDRTGFVFHRRRRGESHALRHEDRYRRRYRRGREGGGQAATAGTFLGCRGQAHPSF